MASKILLFALLALAVTVMAQEQPEEGTITEEELRELAKGNDLDPKLRGGHDDDVKKSMLRSS